MPRDVPWWVASGDEPQGSDSYDLDGDPIGPMEAAMENDWDRQPATNSRQAATNLMAAARMRQQEAAFAPLPAHAEAIAGVNKLALHQYQQAQKRTPFGGDPRTPVGGATRPISAGVRPSSGARPLSATKRPPLGKEQPRPQSVGATLKRTPSEVICAATPRTSRAHVLACMACTLKLNCAHKPAHADTGISATHTHAHLQG